MKLAREEVMLEWRWMMNLEDVVARRVAGLGITSYNPRLSRFWPCEVNAPAFVASSVFLHCCFHILFAAFFIPNYCIILILILHQNPYHPLES